MSARGLDVATLKRHGLNGFRPTRIALNFLGGTLAAVWLMPTVSLAVISLRPEAVFQQSGWWSVLSAPTQLTLQNYQALFSQGLVTGGLLDSLVTSLEITIPSTIFVTGIASLAAYSLVFGRWRGRSAVF
ncbi:MAG TPA: hypothetical protein VHM88_16730, partial [Candidatus Acidoferrales bacterium]|nr:hypothetical protein [Candidatus Acidoferrales bacterium]